jgi:hypothetical protein
MPRGRRPGPGTAEEKAAIRREKVRLNVQAYRKRKQEAQKGSAEESKPNLRWVEDTKWQNEYEQQRKSCGSASESSYGSPAASNTSRSELDDTDSDASKAVVIAAPRFSITPDPSKQYVLSLLGAFPERFLPNQLSMPSMGDIQTLRTPCALWVTTATKQARMQESGALNDVLQAIVLAVMGMEHQRQDVQVHAQQLYVRSLTKTRRSLMPILSNDKAATTSDVLGLLLSCHAAAVYELLVNGSMTDMLRHITGIGNLIEHQRDLPDFPALTGNSLVEEYRMLEIHFCLLERRQSTIGRINEHKLAAQKITPKQGVVDTEVGPISRLLNLADQILPIMVELDSYTKHRPATAGQLMGLVQTALSLHSQLDAWSGFLHDQSFPASPKSDNSSDTDDPVDLSQITQYEFASCYMFSLSYDLHAVGVCVEAVEALWKRTQNLNGPRLIKPSAQILLLRTKALQVAGAILELMPYFFQADKGIIGRSIAIWPLEAVWKALDTESQRLAFDELVCIHTSVADEFKVRTQADRALVAKYYKLCRKTGRSAHSFGLPLLEERSLREEGASMIELHLKDTMYSKSRITSLVATDEKVP